MKNKKSPKNSTKPLETKKQEPLDFLLKEIEKVSVLKFGK